MIGQESRNSWDDDVTSVVSGSSSSTTESGEEEYDESGLSVRSSRSTTSSSRDHCENDPAFEGPGSAPSKNGKEWAAEGSDLIT